MEVCDLNLVIENGPFKVWIELIISLMCLEFGKHLEELLNRLGAVEIVDLTGCQIGQLLCMDSSSEAENLCISGIMTAYINEMGCPEQSGVVTLEAEKESFE